MARMAQGRAEKGSQKWLQMLVNEYPELVNRELREMLRLGPGDVIQWLSPLEDDGYAEYTNAQFLDRPGVTLEAVSLKSFWPRSGPRWDGLARTDRGDLILVEAKAHIAELASGPTKASGKSLAKIRESLAQVKQVYGSRSGADWTICFYQYTNRLAHLYLLRELNDLPAYLLLLCFINDEEMEGPATTSEWEGALELLDSHLGVRRHRLSGSVLHVCIDIQALGSTDA